MNEAHLDALRCGATLEARTTQQAGSDPTAAQVNATLAVAYEARTANLIARAALAERDMRDRLLDEVDARLKETK